MNIESVSSYILRVLLVLTLIFTPSESHAIKSKLTKTSNDQLFNAEKAERNIYCLRRKDKFYSLSSVSGAFHTVAYSKKINKRKTFLKSLKGSALVAMKTKLKKLNSRLKSENLLCKITWQQSNPDLVPSPPINKPSPPTSQPSPPISNIVKTTGEQRVAVVLFNAHPEATNLSTPEEYHHAIFDSPHSVNSYFYEVSNKKTWLVGQTFGWIPLSLPSSQCQLLEYDFLINKASSYVSYANFDRIVFVLNFSDECAFFGRSTFGMSETYTPQGKFILGLMQIYYHRIWNTSNSLYPYEPFSLITPNSTYAHELGHNILAIGHANTYQCSTGAFDTNTANCKSLGASDPFDLMGVRTSATHLNSCFKEKAGWIEPDKELLRVNSTGVFRLFPYASSGDDLKAIRIDLPVQIPTSGSPISSLYIEFRTALAWDSRLSFLPSYLQNTLHSQYTSNKILLIRGGIFSSGQCNDTFLFDMTPDSIEPAYEYVPSNEFVDSSLQIGQSWTVPLNSITITNLGYSSDGGIDVKVEY